MLQVNITKNNKITEEQVNLLISLFNITIKTLKIAEKNLEANVYFVNKREIKKINKVHRGKNSVTDVLSFPTLNLNNNKLPLSEMLLKSNFAFDVNHATNNLMLGDILMCYPVIKKQAKLYGNTLSRELGYMFVHGTLHLLGYDHEQENDKKEMRKLEEKILQKVNLQKE